MGAIFFRFSEGEFVRADVPRAEIFHFYPCEKPHAAELFALKFVVLTVRIKSGGLVPGQNATGNPIAKNSRRAGVAVVLVRVVRGLLAQDQPNDIIRAVGVELFLTVGCDDVIRRSDDPVDGAGFILIV